MYHSFTFRGGFVALLFAWQTIITHAADWNWLNPPSPANDLNGIHVIDDNNIVAVGTVGTIIKTTDGGANWSVLDSGSIWELNAVWFTDAQNGWVASQRGMLRTTDGGETWTQQLGVSVNDPLYALQFVDSQTGWVAGGSGKILKTTDGGNSWVPQTTGLSILVSLSHIHFVDAAHGWAFGFDGTSSHILHSIDGGSTWEPFTNEMPGGVHFFSDRENWWSVGGGALHKTTDGGQTWTPQTLPSDLNTGLNLARPYFKDALEGWLISSTSGIWKTTDAGETWEKRISFGLPDSRAISTIDFRNPDNLWVAGFAGVAYKSTDGGETWTHQTPGIRLTWRDASFVSSSTGWVVGELGSIYKTIDGGSTWDRQTLPDNFNPAFQAVHFVDEQHGWAVGQTGYICSTTNGGETWVRRTSGTTRALRSVFFLDDQTGWAIGDFGTIVHTVNGGADWNPQDSGVSGRMTGIQFLDANNGWAVGFGAVLQTSNGGQDWSALPNAPAGNHNATYFLNVQTGFVVAQGAVHRTINGGADWTTTIFPLNQFQNLNTAFNAVHFADANHGWAVGAAGLMARTTDGGDNWELVFNPIQNPFDPPTPRLTDLPFAAVQFVDADTGWAVGTFGMVLRFGDAMTPPIRLAPPSIGAGGVSLSVTGTPGETFDIQRAPSPEGPWNTIGTVEIAQDGTGSFEDTNPPEDGAYYRMAQF